MNFGGLFGKFASIKSRDIRVAIDIGSASIKTIVFEKKDNTSEITKKMITQFPQREDVLSVVKFINNYIREEIFKAIKNFHNRSFQERSWLFWRKKFGQNRY